MPDEQGVWILDEDDLPLVWLSPLMVRRPSAMEAAQELIRVYNGEERDTTLQRTEEEIRVLREEAEASRAKALAWLAENRERLRAEKIADGNERTNIGSGLAQFEQPRDEDGELIHFPSEEARRKYIEDSKREYIEARLHARRRQADAR